MYMSECVLVHMYRYMSERVLVHMYVYVGVDNWGLLSIVLDTCTIVHVELDNLYVLYCLHILYI